MRLWRRHDGYVLRAFLGAFGAVLVFFTLLTIVVDLAERLKSIRENWEQVRALGYEPMGALTKLYATFVPFVWLRLLPLTVSMAGAFALSRLARHQELVPLVAGGVSTRRVLLPMLLAGLALAGATMAARATVMPTLNREHQALQRAFTKKRPDRVVDVKHVHDAGGGRLSAAAFMPLGRRLEDAWITFTEPDGTLKEMLRYPQLVWDEERAGWFAPQGGSRVPLDPTSAGVYVYPIEPGARAPLASSDSLLEILYESDNTLGLSIAQSAELLRAYPASPAVTLRHHEQFTIPLSILILLASTLALCTRLGPQSALPGLMASLALTGLYFGATHLANDLAGSGTVNPIVLAWTPTVLFGSLAFALFAGMRT
jgi:lipopolysaccharide export system permease protein